SVLIVALAARAPTATLSPYATLFRSLRALLRAAGAQQQRCEEDERGGAEAAAPRPMFCDGSGVAAGSRNPCKHLAFGPGRSRGADRKSTRLNSSHVKISYAVFCLNKK